jgi:hypothetical protein
MKWLKSNTDIVVCNADKNLGPVVMEKTKYIEYAFNEHLNDKNTYRQLDKHEANSRMLKVENDIIIFTDLFKLDEHDSQYIIRTTLENSLKPSYMYLLAKIHKNPTTTRAIISYSGSLCHGISKWLDIELQKIVKHMSYVAKSSAEVVQELKELNLPTNAQLFTMDATSMYTNIHLGHALPVILSFLADTPLGRRIKKEENIKLG